MTSLEIIAIAAILAGVLDLTATSTLMKLQGVPLKRLLQTIASGVLGPPPSKKGRSLPPQVCSFISSSHSSSPSSTTPPAANYPSFWSTRSSPEFSTASPLTSS